MEKPKHTLAVTIASQLHTPGRTHVATITRFPGRNVSFATSWQNWSSSCGGEPDGGSANER